MSNGLDPDVIKYGAALLAVIASIAGWLFKRLTNRVDGHDKKFSIIDKTMVEQNKYDGDIRRIYDKMDTIQQNVQTSVARFEDEHRETRQRIIDGTNEIKELITDSKKEG